MRCGLCNDGAGFFVWRLGWGNMRCGSALMEQAFSVWRLGWGVMHYGLCNDAGRMLLLVD